MPVSLDRWSWLISIDSNPILRVASSTIGRKAAFLTVGRKAALPKALILPLNYNPTVDVVGFDPTASCLQSKRASNCATRPFILGMKALIEPLKKNTLPTELKKHTSDFPGSNRGPFDNYEYNYSQTFYH